MECRNCGKAIKPPGLLRRSVRAGMSLLFLLDGDTRKSLFDTSTAEPGPLQLDLEDGDVWYCSKECKARDLWKCEHCHNQFSRRRTNPIDTGMRPSEISWSLRTEEHSTYLICPDCSVQMAEAIAATEEIHQGLINTIYSEYEVSLRAECDRNPADASVHLRLADYYVERWKSWQVPCPRGSDSCHLNPSEYYGGLIMRNYLELPGSQFRQFASDLSCLRASLRASELAHEALSKAIALGLGAFDEGRAHYWIGQILRWKKVDHTSPLQSSIKSLKRALRREPHNVEALQLLRAAYLELGKTDQLYETDIALQRAEALSVGDDQTGAFADDTHPSTNDVSGIAFEERCFRLLRRMGFVATVTSPTNDGGIDIIATHSQPIISGTFIVQCKDWKGDVGVAAVRELYGVVSAEGANKGVLVASSGFTRAAREFAEGKRIELIDGKALADLLREYPENEPAS